MAEDDHLPDTSDPFELLGIDPTADERETRRAYARLIKRWRPDRAPVEFGRIHDAFEQARGLGTRRAIRTSKPIDIEEDQPAEELSADPQLGGPVSSEREEEARAADATAEILAAIARGDHSDVNATLARALDAGIPAHLVLSLTDGKHRGYLATSPAMTWARIAAGTDHATAHATLFGVIQLGIGVNPLATAALLSSPDIVADAHDDPWLALICLRGIAALAWRSPGALGVYARYRNLPRHAEVDRLLDQLELDLEAGIRYLRSGAVLADPLIAFLRDASLLDGEDYRERAIALREGLTADPASYLASLDQIAAHRELRNAFEQRLIVEGGGDRTEPPSARAELRRQIRARALRIGRRLRLLAAFAIGTAIAVPLGVLWPDLVGSASLMAFSATAIWLTVTAGTRYRRQVRIELATILAEVGIPLGCLYEWLVFYASESRLRFGGLPIAVVNDPGLQLFGRVAAVASRLLDRWPEDEDEDEDEGQPAT